jgi:hypothetical protein
VAPPYHRTSAGAKVLHLLCHLLNLRGQSAFVINPKVNPDLATPVLTEHIVAEHFQNQKTPIIVYPEILHGNPLAGKCVVRYLLNLPGLLGGPHGFPPEDLLIWYSEGYRQTAAGDGPILSIPATDARFFYPPPPGTKRQGSCFYACKFKDHAGEPLSAVTRNSLEILKSGEGMQTQEQIRALFQRSEVFYCYESSALVLEAVLCGCPSVLLPNKHMDKMITGGPLGNAGIAWGTSQEELERAMRTVGEMPERYERWVDQAFGQLDEFIGISQKKAFQITHTEKINLVDPFAAAIQSSPAEKSQRIGLMQMFPKAIRAAIQKLKPKTI